MVRFVLFLLLATRALGAAPYPVLDLKAGFDAPVSSGTVFIGTAGGAALFIARPFHVDAALWRTDGTAEGTYPLLDLPDKADERAVANVVVAGASTYFYADGRAWKSDGTREGTVAMTGWTDCRPLAVFADALVCRGAHSIGVLRAGTVRVLVSGTEASAAPLEGRLVLGTSDGLWITGDAYGASRLHSSRSRHLTAAGGRVFFTSDDALWVTDGTRSGTLMLARASFGFYPEDSAVMPVGDRVVFLTADGLLGWSDGTAAGTRVSPKGGTVYPLFGVLNGVAYFNYDDGVHGESLWRSDGTEGGTWLVRPELRSPAIAAGATRLFFYDFDPVTFDVQLFASDGTAAGTRAIEHSTRYIASGGVLPTLVTIGDTVFFSADDPIYGGEPFVREGNGPARRIANLASESIGWSRPRALVAAPDRLYFVAESDTQRGVWTTDGTPAGTTLAIERPRNVHADNEPQPYAFAGGTLFRKKDNELWGPDGLLHASFFSGTVVYDRFYFFVGNLQVWTSDGTPAGTRQLASGNFFSDGLPVGFAGRTYFSHGTTLYETDGTPEGTRRIARVPAIPTPSPRTVSIGSQRLFVSGGELRRTDETAQGTVSIRAFKSIALAPFVSLGERILFYADDGVHGLELWGSDGTAEGTKLLGDLGGITSKVVVADGIAYFAAADGEHGNELWQSDGTPEGTRLVADIEAGAGSSSPAELTRVGDVLYFAATTSAIGRELWAYLLPETPALTIDDVRVAENGPRTLVPVRLTRAWSHRVTVAYDGPDGAGTLVFEPGETVKTIAVTIANDFLANGLRALTIRLHDANIAIEKTAGVVLIEDDDAIADVALSLIETDSLAVLQVRNEGPATASNVRVCSATVPREASLRCTDAFELRAGESRTLPASGDGTLVARVTLWESDPNPANNELTALLAGMLRVWPSDPRPLQKGTISVLQKTVPQYTLVKLTSSDPTIVEVPATLTIPPHAPIGSATYRALRAGTVTITATTPYGMHTVTLRVAGRAGAFLELAAPAQWRFAWARELTATIRGLTPNGVPTGTVSFFDGDALLATVPATNQVAKLSLSTARPGPRRFTATYSGDAAFVGAASNAVTVWVDRGVPSGRAYWIPGTSSVQIVLAGEPGFPPTGTMTAAGRTEPLDANGTVAFEDLGDVRTLMMNYSGDALYQPSYYNIPIESHP